MQTDLVGNFVHQIFTLNYKKIVKSHQMKNCNKIDA